MLYIKFFCEYISTYLVPILVKVESLRDQLRNRTTSGRRQAYAGNVVDNATGNVTRLNSTDSAFSVSTEDRMVNRVMEMESEIKALKVQFIQKDLHYSFCLHIKFFIISDNFFSGNQSKINRSQ